MSTTKNKQIKWFGMKLTPKQKAKIVRLAERRSLSQKQAVMELVNQVIAEADEPIEAERGSILEQNWDLFGKSEGRSTDISANVDKYLERWNFGR